MLFVSLLVAALLIQPASAADRGAWKSGAPAIADSNTNRPEFSAAPVLMPYDAKPPQQQDATPRKKSATKSSAKKESSKKKPAVTMAGSVVLQTIYDDNILRMSDGFIEEFRRNETPDKWHVETYDDLIFSPRLFLNFTASPLGMGSTKLYLGAITWQYGRNPEKNNDLWSLRLRQYAGKYDYFELNYSYAPPAYIRHLSDREPFTEPRSTTPLQWRPFMGVRHGMELGYTHRISKAITGSIEGGRVLRFYNRPFLENDNWEWNGFGALTWSPSSIWRFYGKYMYSVSDARALDTVGETVATSDDGDGSYERDLYEASIRFSPKGGVWVLKDFEIKGQRQGYYYTGDKLIFEDPLHTGRKDDVNVLELGIATGKIVGPVVFGWGYRFAQRQSSLPGTFEGEDAEDKDYTNNRTWIEARYSF